jgi:hypothetical protein
VTRQERPSDPGRARVEKMLEDHHRGGLVDHLSTFRAREIGIDQHPFGGHG